MNEALCLAYAPVIALFVSLLKRIKFIGKNPKLFAGIFSVLANVVTFIAGGGWKEHLVAVFLCVATSFGVAIGSYEVAKDLLGFKEKGGSTL